MIKTMYNIKGTFLDLQYVLNNIPQSWITQINDNGVFISKNKINAICNILKELMKAKKGSSLRVFYDTFVNLNE